MSKWTVLASLLLAFALATNVQAQQVKWTGAYVGAHAGGTWGGVDVTDTTGGVTPGPFSYDVSGAFGGVTLGYNQQFDQLVAGVEGDVGYMNTTGSGIIPSSNPAAHQDIWLDGGAYAVVAGRLGIAFDRALVYGKAGYAWYGGEAGQQTTNPGYVTNKASGFSGLALGGGVEYMLTHSVSLKAEYLHFDFGSQTGDQTSVGDPPIGFVYENANDLTVDSIKVGVNVHF